MSIFRAFIVLALVFSASTHPSFSQDIRYVRGDLSCKQFVGIQDKNVKEADKYVYWLGGVLTGHSLASGDTLGKGINIACINDYLVKYCTNSGGAVDLSNGLVELFKDLKLGTSDYLSSESCKLR